MYACIWGTGWSISWILKIFVIVFVTDGGRRDLKGLLLHQSSKPFSQKTDREKDELYEHIAGQLATIAYNYTFESPQSASTKSQEATVAKSVTEGAAQFVEMADACMLKVLCMWAFI